MQEENIIINFKSSEVLRIIELLNIISDVYGTDSDDDLIINKLENSLNEFSRQK